MGSVSDRWLQGIEPKNEKRSHRREEGFGEARLAASHHTTPSRYKEATACTVRWNQSREQYEYGDEVPFDYEFALRPVSFPPIIKDSMGRATCRTAILSRFEARTDTPKRFAGKQLVVALLPPSSGFTDAIAFKMANPSGTGHKDRDKDPWTVEELPQTASLLDALQALDRLPYDYYLTSKKHLVAGRFLFASMAPASGKARAYRAKKGRLAPDWVFGLCDNYEKAKSVLLSGNNKKELVATAKCAPPPRPRGPWTENERAALHHLAEMIAERAVQLALAGYRVPKHRKRAEKAKDLSVMSYAKHTVWDIAPTYVKLYAEPAQAKGEAGSDDD